jgi:hypothetical protein
MKIPLTLGYDSDERKRTPMLATVFGYFAAAMAGLARHCVRSNEKHNKGEPVHWARGKSMDHDECSLRHLVDSAEIRAWIRRNVGHPEYERVLTMLEHELDAKVWRAAAEAQEFYEEFRAAPLSFSSRLPAPVVPEGTVDDIDYPEKTFDDFMQEFTAPSDPAKLPRIVDGAPWGEAWAIVDCNGAFMGQHSSYADAESCLREILAPPPVNTPEELAELEKMGGKVVLVAGPGLVDGGHVEHDFPLFAECPSERGNGVDEAGLDRCGHMSSTKRVCTRMGGHAGAHADAGTQWAGIE